MNILHKYLNKLGINYKELSKEDKMVYNVWEQTLKGRKLTDEEVQRFLAQLEEECTDKLRDVTSLNEKQLLYWSMQLDLVKKIRYFLNTPEIEKQIISSNIEKLL